MAWYVYILRCGDGSLYTGITDDVPRRLAAHRSGKGAKYTRGRGPLELVFTQQVEDKSAALRREAEIKKLRRGEKEKLIAQGGFSLTSSLKYGSVDLETPLRGASGQFHRRQRFCPGSRAGSRVRIPHRNAAVWTEPFPMENEGFPATGPRVREGGGQALRAEVRIYLCRCV